MKGYAQNERDPLVDHSALAAVPIDILLVLLLPLLRLPGHALGTHHQNGLDRRPAQHVDQLVHNALAGLDSVPFVL